MKTQLQELADALYDLGVAIHGERAMIKAERALGRYDDCTIYRVKATIVRSHKRRGFTAVRVRKQH